MSILESIAAIETTKESYKTVIDQLNTELVTLKQNFAELSVEHEILKVKLDESNQRLNEVSIKQTTGNDQFNFFLIQVKSFLKFFLDTSTFDEVHPVRIFFLSKETTWNCLSDSGFSSIEC